ncbi:ImmA/IrrE family metallo-endopeptidase [Salinicoccus roseus]|uniref:ImmA/IrrE family metallo-endopeptidase n=1 Tax=Salinicoccus roseus TaxID=45670 RepID=A0A0C2E3N5_9STAP|nr:ImmA/IrrE family metallo-endopeptidase [Salinicoccus roseus]KIH70042.1 hypothetical protein SN16_11100 [Salinicoccus roseus]MDB0581348.1 ImmA/IrrE family metallo-endopeptidase [Salinicoccus roseus]
MTYFNKPKHIIAGENLAKGLIKRDELDVKFFKANEYFDELFEFFDCEVIDFPMNSKISGLTQKDELGLSVMINSNIPNGMINFTYAHELAHVILHIKNGITPEIDTDNSTSFTSRDKLEIEANQFAAQFLLPDISLKSQVLSNFTLYNIKYNSNVSVDVIKWRLISILTKEYGLHKIDSMKVFDSYRQCRTHETVKNSEMFSVLQEMKLNQMDKKFERDLYGYATWI